jgi:septal ring factor EnvC (AmiA/AmiB activator)
MFKLQVSSDACNCCLQLVLLLQAKDELQHLKRDMLCKSQTLQQQVVSLQGQLADAQLQHAASTSQLQQQLTQAERQVASAQREKHELTAALVALRQQESGRRLAAGEAAAKAERLRGELVRCVGELQVQLDASAGGCCWRCALRQSPSHACHHVHQGGGGR